MSMRECKVVLLGEGRVGKTSIIMQYIRHKFQEGRPETIEASFNQKKLMVKDTQVVLNLWDTAGQEKFHSLAVVYYRDANAAVLVYDVTERPSFERVRNWVQELRRSLNYEPILVIAANKIDLPRAQHEVSADEGKRYAESVGATFYMTSAKDIDTVSPVFQDIALRIVSQPEISRSASKAGRGRGGLFVEEDDPLLPKDGGQCGC